MPEEIGPPKASFFDKIKIHKFKILAGILGTLVFVGAIFGAYKLGQRQVQPTSQPSPTPSAVATPIPDQTADWNTYTASDVGFFIKYPKNWYFEENPDFQKPYPAKEVLEVKVQFANFKPPFKGPVGSIPQGCHFDILAMDTEMSLDRFIDEHPTIGSLRKLPERRERIEINGRTAEKRIYLPDEAISEMRTTVYVVDHGKAIVFYYFSELVEQSTSCEQTFNLMLSTFRFISEESIGEKVFCKDPRPEVCTMECISNPPYICGSDGKSYCSECQACANLKVKWYIIQDTPCGRE